MSQNRNPNQSPLDEHKDFILSLLDSNYNNHQIANAVTEDKNLPTTEASIRRALNRWGETSTAAATQLQTGPLIERPGAEVTEDSAVVTSDVGVEGDPAEIVRGRGLDPKDWEFDGITVNEWDGVAGELQRQLKVRLSRKRDPMELLHPAVRSARPLKTKRPKALREGLVVFTGDQQAPYQDPDLHERFCSWLAQNKPEQGILIGDTVDFPDISRHRNRPESDATVQECINAAYGILEDYTDASPDTKWVKLCGNHDERIRNTLIDEVQQLHNLKRAELPDQIEPSVLSPAHLLRLDKLGIYYLEPEGSYEHVQVNVSPYLAARHGWVARKGSGASALATLDHLGYSVIVGHTHRQSLVHKTTHDINGQPTTLMAVEAGCMCRIDEGLGYAVAPDWQQGFATASVWPDGRFKLDLATYLSQDKQLLWRNQRYE
jgi:hypothetical protein